jgi:AbrB family looped-hinge helix DNA binding protein
MTIATMTSKGQVVIPAEIRHRLNLHAGDKLDFTIDAESRELHVHPINKSVDEVFGVLKGKSSKHYSVEDMNAAVAEAFKEGKI